MRVRGVVQSPVLVGRDSFLALIEQRLANAAAGEGRLLFVAGEAGVGKTRLLSAVARQADASSFDVVRAAAFPDDAQSLAGLLLDLAGNLLTAREPALSELGRNLTSRLRGSETMYLQVDAAGADAAAVLNLVPGVTRVAVADTRGQAVGYEVDSQAGRDVRRELAAAVVGRGWGLLELRPMRMSLEEIFLHVTTEEAPATAAAAEVTQ